MVSIRVAVLALGTEYASRSLVTVSSIDSFALVDGCAAGVSLLGLDVSGACGVEDVTGVTPKSQLSQAEGANSNYANSSTELIDFSMWGDRALSVQ